MSLAVEPLLPLGAQIVEPDIDHLLTSPSAPAEIMDLLGARSVVLIRGLNLDDATQLACARRLGELVARRSPGWSTEHPGIYKIALDPSANGELYVKGSWDWHIDGATSSGIPAKASLLSCRVPSRTGGETEFVSTYGAYDRLSDEEKARFADLKVWHQVRPEAYSVPIELTDADRDRLAGEPAQLHPLVWTHRDGRRSLVIGVTASHIEGMAVEEGRALLRDLLDRATERPYVLSHSWEAGDLVMWDNRGTMHRARPYDEESGRDMHRITLMGDEPIQ